MKGFLNWGNKQTVFYVEGSDELLKISKQRSDLFSFEYLEKSL